MEQTARSISNLVILCNVFVYTEVSAYLSYIVETFKFELLINKTLEKETKVQKFKKFPIVESLIRWYNKTLFLDFYGRTVSFNS